jgi:3-hydroxybutyryl-CoA dehydrogenase
LTSFTDAASISRVAVVGAGTMGHGIAGLAARSGFTVTLHDLDPSRARAGLEKIRSGLERDVSRGKLGPDERERALAALGTSADLGEAVRAADLVIEAVPEDLEIKRNLFQALGALCARSALLATNTSCLSVSRIASAAAHPERVVGLHFFNPPAVMKLVEVVRGADTSEATVAAASDVARRMGKEIIAVKDSPGFATSRLGLALGLEAMRMLEQGVASAADIDRALELGYGHPMGPLRVSDLVGLDVRLAIAENLHRELGEAQFRPPEILRQRVREGKLGKKTGEGFYRWPER